MVCEVLGILRVFQRLLGFVALARCTLETPEAAEYVLALNAYSTHTPIDGAAAGLRHVLKNSNLTHIQRNASGHR